MNKTVTVNIGGIVFHIDENAYERFKKYLESIRGHFTTAEGRDEIMQDIEARIAEMFQDRIKDSKQVITLTDVEEITALMGKPEDFGGEESKTEEPVVPLDAEGKIRKRFFRNPDDKMLGGVCSGISAYFDIDPVWIRLVFAISFLFYGSGFLLYILLWIIIPEAKTTAEKLQMRGEPVNIPNIEKNVKEEMEQLKNRVNELSKGGTKKAGTIIGRIFEAIGMVFKFIFMLIGKLIALFFMIIGFAIAFGVIMCLLALFHVPGTTYPHIWDQVFPSGFQFTVAFIGAVLVVSIPFLMLGYAGARMLLNIKKSSRLVNLTALGLWLTGFGLCVVLGFNIAKQYSEKENTRSELSLVQPKHNHMILQMHDRKNEEKDYDSDNNGNNDDADFTMIFSENQIMSKKINLDIVKSPNDSFSLVEIFYARGSSRKEALEHASRINYSFSQLDSLIEFNRYFTLAANERYKAQKVQLVVRVPVGSSIYLDKSLKKFIYDIDNVQNVFDNDMLDRNWLMTEKGLSCIDCDGSESTISGENVDIHGEDGSHVQINEEGVHITGPDGEVVAIDSNGVVIHSKENGVVITNKDKKKKKKKDY